MSAAFWATLNQMGVMFTFIVAGYILRKLHLLPENAGQTLAKLENYLLVPAVSLNSFMKNCTIENLSVKWPIITYSVAILVFAFGLAIILARFFSKDCYERNVYKYALTFANSGYVGNAVVVAVFGEEMLFNYLIFTLPISVIINTWGIYILVPKSSQEKKVNLKNLINPIFIALLIGTLLGITGLTKIVPSFATNAISTAASCMGPVAMILTGFIVGSFDFLKVIKKGKVYIAAALRLIIIPSLMIIILKLFKAPQAIMICAFFAYATPLGLNTVVFPAAYGGDTKVGASMALISHVLSVITIPLMYYILI